MWNIPLFQSISSYHLLLSEDEILTKAEIHLWDVKCQIVSFFATYTCKNMDTPTYHISECTQAHETENCHNRMCKLPQSHVQTLSYAHEQTETTHSASVSYVERQTFDFGGTHLFAQPIK